MQYVITLVHGTKPLAWLPSWRRRRSTCTGWTCPDSRLSKALIRDLGAGTILRPFEWSGGNSIRARRLASERLAAQVRLLAEEYPRARQFVVAHSHGGNVALYALRDDRLARRVAGIACLATPFLHADSRRLGPRGKQYVAIAPLPWLFGAAWLLQAQVFPDVSFFWFSMASAGLLLASIAAIVHWGRWAEGVGTTFATPALDPSKLLIVRLSGDEASAFLLTAQFLTALTTRVFVLAATICTRAEAAYWRQVERTRRLVPAAVAILAGAIAIVAGLRWFEVELGAEPAVRAVGAIALIFLLWRLGGSPVVLLQVVVLILVAPVVLVLSAVLLLSFGPAVASANLFLNVTAESTPPGEWTVHQLASSAEPVQKGDRATAPPMAHSAIYEDEGVLDTLTRWMRRRAAEEPAA